MKQTLLTALAAMIALPAVMGCGPRRTTTVDPLPDPVFRDTPGPTGYQRSPKPSYSGNSRYTRRSAKGPWTVARLSNRWKYIIVHHSATDNGGAERFDRSHRQENGWDELGYHFVIGNGSDTNDGRIEVGSRWTKQKHGAHCRVDPNDSNEYNKHGIGICLVGNFDYGPPSRIQMQKLIYLTKGLLAYTHLPASAVHYHRDFDSTKCPGRRFPYAEYERALRK